MGPGMGAISRKIKWAQKILPVQLDPMPRGIGIEEKQSILQPSNQITALPNAISRKIKWAKKYFQINFFHAISIYKLTLPFALLLPRTVLSAE